MSNFVREYQVVFGSLKRFEFMEAGSLFGKLFKVIGANSTGNFN